MTDQAGRGATALTPSQPAAEPMDVRLTQTFGADFQRPPVPADRTDAELLFPVDVSMTQVLRPHQDRLANEVGFDRAQREELFSNITHAVAEARLSPIMLGEPLATALVEGLSATRHGREADTEKLLREEEAVRTEYRALLGGDRAETLFDETADFIAAHPRLHRLMSMKGFSAAPSAPTFMKALLEHVRVLRRI